MRSFKRIALLFLLAFSISALWYTAVPPKATPVLTQDAASLTLASNTTIQIPGRAVDDTAQPSSKQLFPGAGRLTKALPRFGTVYKRPNDVSKSDTAPYIYQKRNLQSNKELSTTESSNHSGSRVSHPCNEPYCLDYLSETDKIIYSKCVSKTVTRLMLSIPEEQLGCKCGFRDSKRSKLTALVSLPGSGNTWIRGLLQKATGLCTGSIYCDKSLRVEGFCGEGIRSSVSIVIKTHDTALQWTGKRHETRADRPVYDTAIFIVRDPYKAAIAEWNREKSRKFASNQTGSAHVNYINRHELFGKVVH